MHYTILSPGAQAFGENFRFTPEILVSPWAKPVLTVIIASFGALLCVGWLYLTGEFTRRRSLWMVTVFVCIVICVVISRLLSYPCPAPTT